MTGKKDYYQTLGVARTAGDDEIKRAYRRLSKQYHPDRNPNDPQAEARFKEVQQAYSVLRDPKKRAQYDQYGEVGVGEWATDQQGHRVYQWGGSAVNVEDLEELLSAFGRGGSSRGGIFEEIFGGPFGQRRTSRAPGPVPRRGPDQTHEVILTFEQAARGATLSLRLGGNDGTPPQNVEVKVPPGIEDGQKLRLKGRVPGAHGGPPGDLYLKCRIQPHPYFSRRGPDVFVEVPVSVTEAILGGLVEVPSLDGRMTVTLPPGTSSGAKLRLKGRGIVNPEGSGRGDQYVVVKINAPAHLSDEQRALFQKLNESGLATGRDKAPWHDGKRTQK